MIQKLLKTKFKVLKKKLEIKISALNAINSITEDSKVIKIFNEFYVIVVFKFKDYWNT